MNMTRKGVGERVGTREVPLFWDRIRATLSLCATSHSHVAPYRNGQPAAGNVYRCVHVHVDVAVCVCVCVCVWMRPPTVRMPYNTFNSWLEQMMWKCKIDVGLTSEWSDRRTDRQTVHTNSLYAMCASFWLWLSVSMRLTLNSM